MHLTPLTSFSRLQAGNSVSLVTRSAARAQLEACQKATAAAKKASANAAMSANLAALSASVTAAMEVTEQPYVVLDGTLGGDTKALRKAIDTLASASNGQVAALALSVDDESGKLMGVAHVPEHLRGKLAANEWLMAALAPCGGKGGGKADAAQGQAASAKEVRVLSHFTPHRKLLLLSGRQVFLSIIFLPHFHSGCRAFLLSTALLTFNSTPPFPPFFPFLGGGVSPGREGLCCVESFFRGYACQVNQ